MPPGDRIEAFGIKIGHFDRVPGVRNVSAATSFIAPVKDVGSGWA